LQITKTAEKGKRGDPKPLTTAFLAFLFNFG